MHCVAADGGGILASDPENGRFWFVMLMALIVGFITAYPMNPRVVANHLKPGMITVRPKKEMAGMATAMRDCGGNAMNGMAMKGRMNFRHRSRQ